MPGKLKDLVSRHPVVTSVVLWTLALAVTGAALMWQVRQFDPNSRNCWLGSAAGSNASRLVIPLVLPGSWMAFIPYKAARLGWAP